MSPRSKGVSLLELLISMVLLAIAVLALLLLFGRGLKLNSQAEELTRAAEVGRELLEELRVRGGYAKVVPGATFDGRAGDAQIDGFPPEPYPTVEIENRTYQIVVKTAQETPRVRAVLVEVWWDNDSKTTLETAFSL